MGKRVKELLAGIDVSAKKLQVALRGKDGGVRDYEWDNDDAGHRALAKVLKAARLPARVIVEATGTYSVDVCLALSAANVAVMVVNPKSARRFADAILQRAKNDRIDARLLLDYLQRMEFVAWKPPSETVLAVCAINRRMRACIKERTSEMNRLAAAQATASTPKVVIDDIQHSIAALSLRIEALETEGLRLLQADQDLAAKLVALTSTCGIGDRSALALLGELLLLSPDLTVAEVVAHAGLDPRPKDSGERTAARSISRIGNARLRTALYFPALTAAQRDPHVNQFYERLIARGKAPKVAIVAVMRKMLMAVWTMLRTGELWDSSRFTPTSTSNAVA